jgi:hypothetical protein
MSVGLKVPGVYWAPQPRAAGIPFARTDIAGFAGFERRVRDGVTPTAIVGSGHRFAVEVRAFELALGTTRIAIPAARDLVLSADANTVPIVAGGTVVHAVIAVAAVTRPVAPGRATNADLAVVQGLASPTLHARAPSDAEIEPFTLGRRWIRIANVQIQRSAAGDRVTPLILPALPPTRCDDWADFELAFGALDEDGTMLARGVRAFFAQGGARCWVVPTPRPRHHDPAGLARALDEMAGDPGAREVDATGFERLALIDDVAIVDLPDLYAQRLDADPIEVSLPPRTEDACFRRCTDVTSASLALASGAGVMGEPLFADGDVLALQRRVMARAGTLRDRLMYLVTAPIAYDASTGAWRGPDPVRAAAWRSSLVGATSDDQMSATAFYYPWLLAQDTVAAPIYELPPTSFAAGVIARRDLARGPFVAPANERLNGVVALGHPIDDTIHGRLTESPLHLNLMRATRGAGIVVWGARTLSSDHWLRYLSVRRTLTKIERSAVTALRPLVFEPNTPALWFQVTQALLGVLVPLQQAGAFRGQSAAESFYVRCDERNNPPDQVENGVMLCEVGVAIAAPAEFIVFRLGRSEGVVEVLE